MQSMISVCWNITNKCNDTCSFCYRDQISPDLDLEKNKVILQKLITAGIKKITWAGGEPLLYKDIFELMKIAKNNGIVTSMTTNTILLDEESIEKFAGVLDWITFSLDGSNPEVQAKMTRNKRHFDNVMSKIKFIKDSSIPIGIKINTLAAKVNKDDIPNMVRIVQDQGIDRWKIFQFLPVRGDARDNSDHFAITNDEFEKLKQDIALKKEQISYKGITTFTNRKDLSQAYFVVFPNGSVRLVEESTSSDIEICNLLDDEVETILSHPLFNVDAHEQRIKFLTFN